MFSLGFVTSGTGVYIVSKKYTFDVVIQKSNIIHNNFYNYSKFSYIDLRTKGIIICPKHGEFLQDFNHHIYRKHGCPICGNHKIRLSKAFTYEKFLQLVNDCELHKNKNYDYSKFVYINKHTKGIIICPKHGEFLQSPNNHLRGKGCPICKSSKGELKVKSFFDFNHIKYIRQHSFFDCMLKKHLRFDFYLPEYNICIEYQGIQHYKPISYFGGKTNYDITKIRDNIKKEYCKNNNIKLIEIKYSDDIDIMLLSLFNEYIIPNIC